MLDPRRAKPTHCSVCAPHRGLGLPLACQAPEQSGAAVPCPWGHPEQRGCRHSTCQVTQTRRGLGRLAVAGLWGERWGWQKGTVFTSQQVTGNGAGSRLPPAAGTPLILAGTDCTSSE